MPRSAVVRIAAASGCVPRSRMTTSVRRLPPLRRAGVAVAAIALALSGESRAQAQTTPAAPPPALSGCHSPENRQFDFWVGRWSVSPKAAPQQKVADSLIEKLYDGCAVRENWMPLKGGGGGSLNAYRPADGIWRQTWIDAQGSWAEFSGTWNGRSMVIEGGWAQPGHPDQRTRMTYTPLPDGAVEQRGETSDDRGKTWQPSFDLIYRKAADGAR
jgi:hypothetical protein